MIDTLPTFADNVRRLRKERGFTQQQLADAAEMSKDHLGKIERKKREPGARTVARLTKGLGISGGPLFEGIDGVKRV